MFNFVAALYQLAKTQTTVAEVPELPILPELTKLELEPQGIDGMRVPEWHNWPDCKSFEELTFDGLTCTRTLMTTTPIGAKTIGLVEQFDIQLITGVFCSRAPIFQIANINDIAKHNDFPVPTTIAELDKLIAGNPGNLFSRRTRPKIYCYRWLSARYWSNSDSSHRFSAIRSGAAKLGQERSVAVELHVAEIDKAKVHELGSSHYVLAVRNSQLLLPFLHYHKIPYIQTATPRGAPAGVVFLRKTHAAATLVGHLMNGMAVNLVEYLLELCKRQESKV